jgi:hypothetical protein
MACSAYPRSEDFATIRSMNTLDRPAAIRWSNLLHIGACFADRTRLVDTLDHPAARG